MLFEGQAVQVRPVEDGIYNLVFDRKGDAVNKLDQATLEEVRQAVAAVSDQRDLKGLLFTSAKDSFIVGADITEFMQFFAAEDEELLAGLLRVHELLNQIEDLPCPTVTAINGLCLGGGFELALSTDYRVWLATPRLAYLK